MSSTFPFPCTSNPFERDTYVSSPHDRGFCEVPSPCIFTKYLEEISLFNLDLRCCGKQSIFSKYLKDTVSSHKQAKNPACCCMNPRCRILTHFHGMLVDVFNNQSQNLKENNRKFYTSWTKKIRFRTHLGRIVCVILNTLCTLINQSMLLFSALLHSLSHWNP